jgi:hypothetical protein
VSHVTQLRKWASLEKVRRGETLSGTVYERLLTCLVMGHLYLALAWVDRFVEAIG